MAKRPLLLRATTATVAVAIVVAVVVVATVDKGDATVFSKREAQPATRREVPLTEPSPTIRQVIEYRSDRESPSLAIEVANTNGNPVTGATVLLLGETEEAVLGTTDQYGVIRVAGIDLSKALLLRAEHPYYATELRRFSAPIPSPISMVLDSARAISGQVLRIDGAVPSTEITVAAWPAEEAPPSIPEVLQRVRSPQARPALRWVTTDEDGTFILANLEQDRRYYLVAGGGGLASRQPTLADLVDGNPLVLSVFQVHAAAIRLKTPAGHVIPPPKAISVKRSDAPHRLEQGYGRRWSETKNAQVIDPYHAIALAAPQLPYGNTDDAALELCLYLSAQFDMDVGPNYAAYKLPGYEPTVVTFSAPAAKGDVQVYDAVLTPTTNCFGSLRMTFVDASGRAAAYKNCPEGVLMLRTSEGQTYRTYVRPSVNTNFAVVENVPCGEYEISFQAVHHALEFPARGIGGIRTHINSNTSDFEVVLGESYGAIDVRLKLAGGQLWQGTTQFVISRERPFRNASGNLEVQNCAAPSFANAPYIITGLPAGRYWVRSSWPHMDMDTTVPVDVTPNAVASLELAPEEQ